MRLASIAAAVAVLTIAAPRGAGAQSAEDFYKGKTVQAMVGFGVGGTDDFWTRLLARFMQDHIPGKPNVVPVNVPGAGSLLLANQIYNTQPKDGTVFGLINRGVVFEPLLGGPGVRFDPLKFKYVGSPDLDTPVCAIRSDSPVQSLEDLRTKELIVGATGSGADSQVYPEVVSKLLGLKIKIVQGYPGSREIMLAMERNEVQGGCVSFDTIARDANYRDKKIRILFQAAPTPDPRIDAPTVVGLAKTDDERQALQLFLVRQQVGRPFVAPPEAPDDRVAILRDAFKAAMEDEGFKAEATQAKVNPRYVSPQEIENVIKAAYKTPASAVALTKKAFGR